ncbi:MAG: bifunctional alpha/beta hydrolase/OsmC family protein [Deferrisoma sp.]
MPRGRVLASYRNDPVSPGEDAMQSTAVRFPGPGGAELAGRLDRPEHGPPRATALFAHCFTCGKDLKGAVHLARALTERGIAVLRFDFAGLGESTGAFARTTLAGNLADLRAAARFLEAREGGPHLLVGHSLGGTAALLVAGDLPAVRAVVTLGAPADPLHATKHLVPTEGPAFRIEGRPYTLDPGFVEDLRRHDVASAVRALGRALLVLHSPLDRVVGLEHAARLYQAARHPKSFVSLDTADHLLSAPADARYAAGVIAAWAERYLPEAAGPGPEPAAVTVRTAAGGFRTEIAAGAHALVADEPRSVGGTEEGPSPYDLLLAALGACTTMTVQMYARRKDWPLAEAVARLRHERIHAKDCEGCGDGGGGMLDRVERVVEFVGEGLSADQRARLLEIANRCPVHRTLTRGVQVETREGGE